MYQEQDEEGDDDDDDEGDFDSKVSFNIFKVFNKTAHLKTRVNGSHPP